MLTLLPSSPSCQQSNAYIYPFIQYCGFFSLPNVNRYSLDNLKFGKVDVGRYPELAKKYYIDDSSFSRQLPTVIVFKNGEEHIRRPSIDSKGRLQKFIFSEVTSTFLKQLTLSITHIAKKNVFNILRITSRFKWTSTTCTTSARATRSRTTRRTKELNPSSAMILLVA